MINLLSLGDIYVSDFLDSVDEYEGREKSSLSIVLDEKYGAPRLESAVDPDQMYGRYWYHSGTNASMTQQLKNIVDEVKPE